MLSVRVGLMEQSEVELYREQFENAKFFLLTQIMEYIKPMHQAT